MCKLTENSYRDVNIAFANELSIICDRLNIDVWELIALANRHPRVDILRPGPGVGGHCIAVDPWFIVDSAADQARIIKAAREINDSKPDWVIQRVDSFAAARPRSRQGGFAVACLGLSFKPDIDDLRESPALAIATKLSARGYAVAAVEPNLPELEHHAVPANIELLSLDDALDKADLTIVLVKHKEFVTARDRIRDKNPLLDVVGLYNE
jgi:UDP-N-acetyl-D-mannosaminuronic acid dehydrogenase